MTACLLLAAALASPAGAATKEASSPGTPKPTDDSYIWDLFHQSVVRPTTRVLDPGVWVRAATGHPREAANVDENDQVRLPSTWWQPRLGFSTVTVEQMLHGPGPGRGPAPGVWTVIRAKTQGVTPGFQIRDADGVRWLIKFDAPEFPELCTSLDVVGSYLFWAAGYNVPENVIMFFRPENLVIDPKATYTDDAGRAHPFTRGHLDDLLGRVARQNDGRFRVIASRYLKGTSLGPFRYDGRRRDDPEDRIPHELRRELRGLWALAAWTNHCDCRSANTLDMWVEENGRSFVRHHLIDFGAILGAGPSRPRSPVAGSEYYLDPAVASREALTLGTRRFRWEHGVDPHLRSVGRVDVESFDPVHWKPDYPNPAFDARTARDARWGARIVAAFTDAHIRAAVEAARYSDPRATDYLTRVLIARRDLIVKSWLGGPVGGEAAR